MRPTIPKILDGSPKEIESKKEYIELMQQSWELSEDERPSFSKVNLN